MSWEVEYTDTFETWWTSLTTGEQKSVATSVGLLATHGPELPFPYSSGVKGSSYRHMRELRIRHGGRPYRVLYAFDHRRTAILLMGGNKTGSNRWYDQAIPLADRLYREHLAGLTEEERTDG